MQVAREGRLIARIEVACSKRSDSGERCGVKKAMKSRGGLGREVHLSPSLAFIFSRSFLLRTAPHYLNAWNRLVLRALSWLASLAQMESLLTGYTYRT